jgi:hypothetical protein
MKPAPRGTPYEQCCFKSLKQETTCAYPGGAGQAQSGSRMRLTSSAGAEWVSAPTLM